MEISDYSLSQATLDDVFIHFANMQSNDEGASKEEQNDGKYHLEEEEKNDVKCICLSLPTLIPRPKDVSIIPYIISGNFHMVNICIYISYVTSMYNTTDLFF